ncbi:ABC transporter ATP-binding protein [Aquisalimonas asiatica]|uniref:ABC-type iron transport system FetAB, ATPase component n=1 Tax=Aquisalimonas asiatica TaxID=406100 RepID=A0A1H8VAP5_9GAMM|nr:ATP-binding cassette domain-containing protein [Aquisalimonas asiatica]SEP12364.1 ABC-type iron transport system FetAB, ATPase component [Aquisalimonas asiatica]
MLDAPARLTIHDLDCGSLTGVSLAIDPGEVVCLSGTSGGGKSRLLRAIADLDAHTGDVWWGDLHQGSLPGHQWRQRVMLLPAEAPWWFERVGAHFPATPDPSDLAAVGLPADAMDWPITRLSSGERQRAALLRMMAHGPQALLLDEPTANLDATTTERVEAWLLRRIRTDRLTVLWVAHDMAQVRRVAGRHLRINGNRLEAVAWT